MHETKGWNVHHGDQIVGRFEAMEHLEGIVTGLFHGEQTFEEAMERAERECNAILAENRWNPSPYALYLFDSSSTLNNPKVESICTQNQEIIAGFPWHPGSARILSLAAKADNQNSTETLIDRYPDHPLGLLAFDLLHGSLQDPKSRSAIRKKV